MMRIVSTIAVCKQWQAARADSPPRLQSRHAKGNRHMRKIVLAAAAALALSIAAAPAEAATRCLFNPADSADGDVAYAEGRPTSSCSPTSGCRAA